MNSAPFETWEGAEAIFTFADNPTIMGIILILAVIACFGAIWLGGVHETEAYRKNCPE